MMLPSMTFTYFHLLETFHHFRHFIWFPFFPGHYFQSLLAILLSIYFQLFFLSYSFLCPGSCTPQVKLHDFIAATLCHFFISLSLRTLLNSLAWRWSFRFVPFWFLKQMGSSNQNSMLCFLVGCVYFPIKMDKIVIVYLFPYLCMFSLLCSSRSGWARKSARLEPFPRFWQLFMAVIFLLEENPPYWKKTHPTDFLGYWKCSVAAETTQNEFSSPTGLEIGSNKLITSFFDQQQHHC